MKVKLCAFMLAFLLATVGALAGKAPDLVSEFAGKFKGFGYAGKLMVMDIDGDGLYECWSMTLVVDTGILFGKVTIYEKGKFKIKADKEGPLPLGSFIDVNNGANVEFSPNFDQVFWAAPLKDSTGNEIGKVIYNEDFAGFEDAFVFPYGNTFKIANGTIDGNDVNVNLNLIVTSQKGNEFTYEFDAPTDKHIVIYVYDAIGNVVNRVGYNGKGNYTNTVNDLSSGTYYIVSPASPDMCVKVVIAR